MSWWNAIYKNNDDDYVITFGSKDYKKTKAVEKVCGAVIDGKVNSPDDVEIIRHGKWEICCDGYYPYCSECVETEHGRWYLDENGE